MLYWVPCNDDDIDPQRHVSIIYDNRARLEDRIERLKSGVAYAQEPKSRLRRVVSNVEIEEGANGEITVYSNFNLTELRRSRQDTFAGRTIHKLRPEGVSFKIASKKVLLVNNDEVIDNLTFLI
jgi:3-phenylpropionate/cinnamic acid dioxygenase small subunit